MTGGDGKVVCVTGAAGYIASWLIKLLLDGGYNVRATVRDPNDVKKTEHLLQLDGAKERLQLFRGNLMEEGSFDSIVYGCVGVFHTASPVFLETKDPQAELVDPAIKGTLNVLKSCAKANSIKRVVFTSSIAAVIHNDKPLGPDVVVDESWISDPEFCEKEKLWYMLGKTLAENAAWKFAKENGIDLVVINPGYVLGPPLQSTINFTLEILLKVVKGAPTFQNFTDRWVDVRDVANAHVQAFENPSANGRYCMAGRAAHWSEVVEILHQLFPDLRLPDKCEDDKPYAPAYQVSKEKAESLGIDFIPFETSLKDTIESFKERKYI